MINIRKSMIRLPLIAAALLVSGCLVSGTFVVVDSFSFTTQTGFYAYQVNITDEADWEDHKDEIDNIDLVGFELWITNNESFPVTFNAYIDDFDNFFCQDGACFNANTTKSIVLENLTLPAGPGMQRHVTYGESFDFIRNTERMKTLVKEGRLNYYGTASAGTDLGFIVDSGKVIVTFSASGT